MSLINSLAKALKEEYLAGQENRLDDLRKGVLHTTTIITPCEVKLALAIKGIAPPPQNLEDVGARLHGTILHRAIEEVVKKRIGGLLLEKGYSIKHEHNGKEYTIVAHPDMATLIRGTLYDIKTVSPYKFYRIMKDGKVPLGTVLQMNMYAYILGKNGHKIKNAYVEYVSKSSVKIGSRGANPVVIKDFDLVEANIELNPAYVKLVFRHLDDVLTKLETGEKLLGLKDSVEKWRGYMEELGLDTEMLDYENYPKWYCEYCDYRNMESVIENVLYGEKGDERESADLEVEM